MNSIESLEIPLDDFDAANRAAALDSLIGAVGRGEIALPTPGSSLNLHGHTFFSFNGYGYSPTGFAWRARRAGLVAAGIVDFDVLDGVDEFLRAANRLGLRACAGIETRVFIPEFDGREINSPGEPGIAYHMGVGFASSKAAQPEILRGFSRFQVVLGNAPDRDVVPRLSRPDPTGVTSQCTEAGADTRICRGEGRGIDPCRVALWRRGPGVRLQSATSRSSSFPRRTLEQWETNQLPDAMSGNAWSARTAQFGAFYRSVCRRSGVSKEHNRCTY